MGSMRDSFSGLPFVRPPLSRVAAFVGKERQRRIKEKDKDKSERESREQTIADLGNLTRELSGLVQRLLRSEHPETNLQHLETIAAAICTGESLLVANLKKFWAENSDFLAAFLQEVQEDQKIVMQPCPLPSDAITPLLANRFQKNNDQSRADPMPWYKLSPSKRFLRSLEELSEHDQEPERKEKEIFHNTTTGKVRGRR